MTNPASRTEPITVNLLGGRLGISQLGQWDDRETEPLPDEIDIGFSSHEFASQKEAEAFRNGVDAGAGWLGHKIIAQSSTSRRVRFGLTSPKKTQTFRFSSQAEAEAFDEGLEAAEDYSEIMVLDPTDAADIKAARERELSPAP
ncbi:hypothetical protein [Bradyrhizobium sp. USDA 4350]